jgi:triosephosphate isomerase (TIM)
MKTPARTVIIAGNWKMNYGPRQAAAFAGEILSDLVPLIEASSHIISIICPPAISLAAVQHAMREQYHQRIELGAQNMYFEEKGAFTGELAPSMVRELCTSVILGHSERRAYFGESDELVNKKTLAALHHELRPIVCIGERLDQYDAGQTREVIQRQSKLSLGNLLPEHVKEVVIAYEPIWAIGTGKAATAEGAGEVIHYIRQLFGEMYGDDAARAVRILYGGSVTSNNIGEFMAHPDIDGALVGGASIKTDFVEIVRKTIETVGM